MATTRTVAEIQGDVISVEAWLMQAFQKASEERTEERIYNIFKWTVSTMELYSMNKMESWDYIVETIYNFSPGNISSRIRTDR